MGKTEGHHGVDLTKVSLRSAEACKGVRLGYFSEYRNTASEERDSEKVSGFGIGTYLFEEDVKEFIRLSTRYL
jgi:hypothetical protein